MIWLSKAFIEIPTEVDNEFKQRFKESHSGGYGFAGITGSHHHIFDFINQDLTLTTRTRRGVSGTALKPTYELKVKDTPSLSDDDWIVKNLKLDPELMKNDTKFWSELYDRCKVTFIEGRK